MVNINNLLKPDIVAEVLDMKVGTIKGWLREGKLKGVKVGVEWRMREADLEIYINNLDKGIGV